MSEGAPRCMQVLLLDEITVDLDVLARADFLKFLIEDCETRGMTVVYVSSCPGPSSCWNQRYL